MSTEIDPEKVVAMTDEQMDKAVAIKCGEWYHKPTDMEIASGSYYQYEPNYTRSLDLMHLTEEKIPRYLWPDYTMALRKIIQRDCNSEPHYILGCERAQHIADFWFYHATAKQRAEAFLEVMP